MSLTFSVDDWQRRPYRSELEAGVVVFLLVVRFAGREFRWSTRPIAVTTDAGDAIPFRGGLDEESVKRALSSLSESPELLSVAFDLLFPEDFDVAETIQNGHDLSASQGELSQLVEGNTWENRRILIQGWLERPQYGAANELVSFSLTEHPFDDTALWPPAAQRITPSTWATGSNGYQLKYEGLVYPQVSGAPGVFLAEDGTETKFGATPAYVVETTSARLYAEKLLAAGHRCAATTVTVFYYGNSGGDGSTSLSTSIENDDLGQEVTVVDTSSLAINIKDATEWRICWDGGGGFIQLDGTAAAKGLGEVAGWWLDKSSLRINRGRLAALGPSLNTYLVAGYTDERVVPFEWVQDNLLPLVPVTIHAELGELFPILWEWDAPAWRAIDHLEVRPGVDRIGPVEYDRPLRSVIGIHTLRWAHDDEQRIKHRVTVMSGDPDLTDPEQITSVHAKAALRRYAQRETVLPPRDEDLETEVLYDEATAHAILAWRVVAHGFAHRVVVYDVDQRFAWWPLGAVITLTDAGLSFTDVVCLVQGVELRDTGRCEVTLHIVEDVLRGPLSTGPNPDDGWDPGGT